MERWVSDFYQWVDSFVGYPLSSKRKLPGLLRYAAYEELPRRDEKRMVVCRSLQNTDGLRMSISDLTFDLFQSKTDGLFMSVVTPQWTRGWSRTITDDPNGQMLTSFLHFSRQYVLRGVITAVMAAIAMTYRRWSDFRWGGPRESQTIGRWPGFRRVGFSESHTILVEDVGEEMGNFRREFGREIPIPHNTKSRRFRTLVHLINGLDPFIQRAVYYYIKALQLDEHGFSEEAVVALDNVIEVGAQFTQSRFSLVNSSAARNTFFQKVGLSCQERTVVILLSNLRNQFGAHPSATKWWDFDEIFGDDIEHMFRVCDRALVGMCRLEQQNRIVEPVPSTWSGWFNRNVSILWDATWFHRVPDTYR